jgi:hypothetical protein
MAQRSSLREGDTLDDELTGLAGADGMFSVCGFGSLLSGERDRGGEGGARCCVVYVGTP